MLQPEVHFVQVKTVSDIVPALQRLRANASHARRIAAAGRAFALRQLSYEQILAYVRALLRGYAARQPRGTAIALGDGYAPVRTAADVMALTGLCACDKTGSCPAATGAAAAPRQRSGARRRASPRAPICCVGWDCPSAAPTAAELCGA